MVASLTVKLCLRKSIFIDAFIKSDIMSGIMILAFFLKIVIILSVAMECRPHDNDEYEQTVHLQRISSEGQKERCLPE